MSIVNLDFFYSIKCVLCLTIIYFNNSSIILFRPNVINATNITKTQCYSNAFHLRIGYLGPSTYFSPLVRHKMKLQ